MGRRRVPLPFPCCSSDDDERHDCWHRCGVWVKGEMLLRGGPRISVYPTGLILYEAFFVGGGALAWACSVYVGWATSSRC